MKIIPTLAMTLAALGPFALAQDAAPSDAASTAATVPVAAQAPAFHAEWTPEEQAALLHLRRLIAEYPEITRQYWEELRKLLDAEDPTMTQEEMEQLNEFTAEWIALLDSAISGGPEILRGNPCSPKEGSQTHTLQGIAAFLGDLEAIKVMVLRGADPNVGILNTEIGYAEPPLGSVLAGGTRYSGYATLTVADRLAMADWLLEHGAETDVPQAKWDAFVLIGAGLSKPEHMEILEWALDHGLPVRDGVAPFVLRWNGTLPWVRRLVEQYHWDPKQDGEHGNALEELVCSFPVSDCVAKARYLIGLGVPVTPQAVEMLVLRGFQDDKEEDWEDAAERSLELLELFIDNGGTCDLEEIELPEDPELAEEIQAILNKTAAGRQTASEVYVPAHSDNAAVVGLFRQNGYPAGVLRAVQEFGLENTQPRGERSEGVIPVKLKLLPQKDFIVLQLVHHGTLTWETYVATPEGRPLLFYRHSHLMPPKRVYQEGDDMVLDMGGWDYRLPILGKNLQPGMQRYRQYIPWVGGAEYARALPEEYDAHRFERLLDNSIQTTEELGGALAGIQDKDSADISARYVERVLEEMKAREDELEAFTRQEFPDEVLEYFAIVQGLYQEKENAATAKVIEAMNRLEEAGYYGSEALKNAWKPAVDQ